MILALGVTEPVGEGVRDPQAMLAGLKPHLTEGGQLIWGDLTWLAEAADLPAPALPDPEPMPDFLSDKSLQQAARAAYLRDYVQFGFTNQP